MVAYHEKTNKNKLRKILIEGMLIKRGLPKRGGGHEQFAVFFTMCTSGNWTECVGDCWQITFITLNTFVC